MILLAALPLRAVAQQPIPFSHKRHAASQVACKACHPNAASAERAGLPDSSQCLLCHANIQKHANVLERLAAFQKPEKPIPWARIYRLPDFVFFSHAKHGTKVSCAECHGRVERRDVLTVEVVHNMKTCLNCHRSRKASVECHTCHELGR